MGPSDRRGVLALFGALGSLVFLPGCCMAGEGLPTYRYRLAVEAETPEGLRTGTAFPRRAWSATVSGVRP